MVIVMFSFSTLKAQISCGLKRVFEKLRVGGTPNCRNKATISNFFGVMWTSLRVPLPNRFFKYLYLSLISARLTNKIYF